MRARVHIIWYTDPHHTANTADTHLPGRPAAMGCCFSGEGDNERRYLLSTQKTKAYQPPRITTVPISAEDDVTPKSARRKKPRESPAPERTDAPLAPIIIKPVQVAEVDKRLRDHAQLYNDHLERRNTLKGVIDEMRESFPDNNPNHNLHDCFYHVKTLCKESKSVMVTRKSKWCMEISFEGKDVHYSVCPIFMAFNKGNKLVKEIIDKGPHLVDSVQMVVENERELRREVLVASLGSDGPDSMKNCLENVAELKKVPNIVADIKSETIKMFEEMKSAAQLLVSDESTSRL